MLALLGNAPHDGVGESLPPSPLMASSLMRAHRKRSVQEEDSLFCPSAQATGLGCWDAKLIVDFLKDVPQRRREWHSVGHGEAEPLCLFWLVIGVLPKNDDANALEGAKVEGVENLPSRGIAYAMRIFLSHKCNKVCKVWGREFGTQPLCPRGVYFYLTSHLI